MERDPPRKKKKYVPTNSVKQASSTKVQNPSFVETDKKEGKALERSRFDYTFQEIINHLLARLLPDSNFTIKLSEKLIFGEQKLLDSFIVKLDNNIKYMTGVTIEMREGKTKEDIDYKMTEEYRGKTFNSKLIQMSVRNFFDGTKYQRQYLSFLSQFKDADKNRLYVRINKTYLQDFLAAIEEEGTLLQGENGVERPRRGNRTRFKNTVDSIELNVDQIDIADMKKFFSRSDKLDLHDIQIQTNKNEFGTAVGYKISLKCYEQQSENKIHGFRYYFRHQNFVNLPLKESRHKAELIEDYSQIDQKNIKIRLIKGYKSSKWDDKSLLYKIRMDQISKKKSNYTNQYFEAFHLVGILPTVAEHIDELEHRINQVPMDDVKEQIFVQFDQKIKDNIRSKKKVQTYIQNFILAYMKQFSSICEVQSVKFPLRGIKLNIKVRSNQQESFKDIESNIAHTMPKHIIHQKFKVDFLIDDQFLQKLEEANILVVEYEDKEFTYVSSTEDVPTVAATIQRILEQFANIGQQSLTVMGFMKKVKYMQVIAKIKEKSAEYKDIMVPEPFSNDNMKFKIIFYGPRKNNDAFFEQVKRTIQKMESQLGQYCECVDSREAAIIIEDSQFQKQIQKKYKISLMLGQFQQQARLQVGQSEITIIKDKNFDRIPLGYWIYLDSKVFVSELKQKYLQKFKINVKRYKKEQWLDYEQTTRNYRFVYKQNFILEDMLSNAFGQSRASKDDPIYIALFMPAVNKDKWIESLLTYLTPGKLLGSQKYNIYIIQKNNSENIAKIVDLPQYTPFNSQIDQFEVEWSCQNKKYSQSANMKINDAVANRLSEIILGKEDIQIDAVTHLCDLNINTIQCWKQSRGQLLETIPIKFVNNGITFDYKGHSFEFPVSEYNKVIYNRRMGQNRFFLSMPFYKIDLTQMQQINIFTDYIRPITKKQIKIETKHKFDSTVKAFYNEKITELIYSFREEDQKYLNSAATDIFNYRKQLWKRQEIAIQEITVEKFRNLLRERIEARAQQCGLKYTLDASIKKIVVESLSEKDMDKFRKLIENESKYLQRLSQNTYTKVLKDIKYPDYWQPQQKDIQAFEVKKNTAEFLQVQNQFAIKPIHSLFRIQNKIIYKKYNDQVQHLTYMNGKEPRQMKLFHGTYKTSPQVIWADNEDGFNINYSGDNNLLGRGIYFAEKSQYSQHYASVEISSQGVALKCMFLCQVLVGDSQNMIMSSQNRNVKGTQPKPNGMRYESMRGIHPISKIYVVYKNRRAYPLYFIKFQP